MSILSENWKKKIEKALKLREDSRISNNESSTKISVNDNTNAIPEAEVNAIPFNASINNDTFLIFLQKHRDVLQKHSDDVTIRKKFSGLLKDYFPQEPKKVRVLVYLHEMDIFNEIANADIITSQLIYRIKKRLDDEYGVKDDLAEWGIDIWCSCYAVGKLGKQCEYTNVDKHVTVETLESQARKSLSSSDNQSTPPTAAQTVKSVKSNNVQVRQQINNSTNPEYIPKIVGYDSDYWKLQAIRENKARNRQYRKENRVFQDNHATRGKTDKKRVTEQDRKKQKLERINQHIIDMNLNVVGKTVTHKTYGKGTITKHEEKYIYVQFTDNEKAFIYPDAFSSHLLIDDTDLADKFSALLENVFP